MAKWGQCKTKNFSRAAFHYYRDIIAMVEVVLVVLVEVAEAVIAAGEAIGFCVLEDVA